MKIIEKLIQILEFNIKKDNKDYSEEELKKFAQSAMLSGFFLPPNAFSYAVKAKRSKDIVVVKKAKRAEIIALFVSLPFLLIIFILVVLWFFSVSWFLKIFIIIIGFILYKRIKTKIKLP